MDHYQFEVRRNGALIFVSEPMDLDTAVEMAAARVEPGITAEVFEYEDPRTFAPEETDIEYADRTGCWN